VTPALRDGELKVEGRLTDASNATLYCSAVLKTADRETSTACVYKPIAGENPLWDFPDGTLAAREMAAYEVSAAAGWDLVPPTVLRDGPFGPGMCQQWIETADDAVAGLFAVLAEDGEHEGWCPVVTVGLANNRQALFAHRDDAILRRVALFDVVINNADRKGGHLLPGADGKLYAIDHGVSFHTDDKLRTLLWGFADRSLTDEERSDLARLRDDTELNDTLARLLSGTEAAAFRSRITALLRDGVFPGPGARRRPIPWPLI
jgi:uncharacterized repeat protein (TIGR03843 family)